MVSGEGGREQNYSQTVYLNVRHVPSSPKYQFVKQMASGFPDHFLFVVFMKLQRLCSREGAQDHNIGETGRKVGKSRNFLLNRLPFTGKSHVKREKKNPNMAKMG